jgi:hypothetical protein
MIASSAESEEETWEHNDRIEVFLGPFVMEHSEAPYQWNDKEIVFAFKHRDSRQTQRQWKFGSTNSAQFFFSIC